MLEINEAERKKEKKEIKRNEDILRDVWDNFKCPNIQIIGVPEEDNRKKRHEKIFEETIVNNFPNMESPNNPESPKLERPKAKHPKTYINQINKDQTQRTNIKSSKGETTNNTQRDSHKDKS